MNGSPLRITGTAAAWLWLGIGLAAPAVSAGEDLQEARRLSPGVRIVVASIAL